MIKVYAFVGPAGTGKSQRAQLVASHLDADYIVDDGLVIHKGRIVCGKSAKAERNQVRAIRRAMFEYDDHRKAVKDFFAHAQPCTVLILATSDEMALKIRTKLDFPPFTRTIHIEDVATPEEIARARRERLSKRQHIIPVSHVLVRKNFAGKLVGRLKVFWKPKAEYEGEKTIVRPPYNFLGDVHIAPEVVEKLISHVVMRTSQVASLVQARVNSEGDHLNVEVDLQLRAGDRAFFETAQQVRRRIIDSVRYFCGLEIERVDVNIVGVVT